METNNPMLSFEANVFVLDIFFCPLPAVASELVVYSKVKKKLYE